MTRFALPALAALSLCVAAPAQTQTPLLAAAHTIAGGGTSKVDPAEQTFRITAAGNYKLTLTDLKIPAPFALLTVAVTSGNSVVATASVPANAGTAASAVAQWSATAGCYAVHVVGALSSGQTYGSAGVQLTDSAGNPVSAFSGSSDTTTCPASPANSGFTATLSLPPSAPLPSNARAIQAQINVTTAGTYQVDVADLAFPAALSLLTVSMADPNGQTVAGFPISASGTAPQTVSFNAAAPGTYTLVAGAQAASAPGGLFSIHVHGPADLYAVTASVGQVVSLGTSAPAAGTAALSFSDLKFPAALSQGAAVAVQSGATSVAASTATASPASFTASGGTYALFALAVPNPSGGGAGTPAGAGAYSVTLTPSSGAGFSAVQAVGSGSTYAYAYGPVTISSAGSDNLTLADFNFPQTFTAIQAVAVQNGALIGQAVTPAAYGNVTLQAGTAYLLVAATPGSGGTGLFGVTLGPAAGGTTFATTQGVGGAFGTTTVAISSGGGYDVTLSDLAFPGKFQQLAAVVTQGATQQGSVYGTGTFHFNATAGTYTINVLATPAQIGSSGQSAGTYGVSVAPTPPAPTVTLTASATQVDSGGTVTLTWSSQNATSCAATGGWTGTLATSGTQTSAALTSSTTFTLTCSGPGGASSAQSVTVSISPPKSGGGGGGSWDGALLLLLLGGVAARSLQTSTRPGPCH